MGAVMLDNLHMRQESLSYADALHAVLTHAGLYQGTKPMLAGMTVSAFRFTVDSRLTAESTTAYNWMAENFLACDFIGAASSQSAGFVFQPTFPFRRRHVIAGIKASIDRGIGAIFWHGGFVVAAGYDDERELLYYSDGTEHSECGEGYRILPWDDFGRNGTPYWYYQTVDEGVPMDPHAVFKESFVQAVFKWETHDILLPELQYGCGRAAYAAMIAALASGNYDAEGARAVFAAYAAAKRDIAAYTAAVSESWPAAAEAADQYGALSAVFGRIASADADRERLELLREAASREEQAVEALRRLVRETTENRRHDIGLR